MKLRLTVIGFLFAFQSLSQDLGYIEYDIEVKGITPELDKGALMLVDSKMRVSYSPDAIRQDYKLGELSTKTTILNKKYNQSIFFENGMGGKTAIIGTNDEISSMAFQDTNVVLELVDEEKIILGFVCKKATLTFASGEKAEYWYTTEFPVKFPKSNFFNSKIPGTPLEFSTVANGYFMRFKCANYAQTIEDPERYFAPIVSKDYTVIDFKSYLLYLEMEKKKQLEQEAAPKK
jgi:hypothetical protein